VCGTWGGEELQRKTENGICTVLDKQASLLLPLLHVEHTVPDLSKQASLLPPVQVFVSSSMVTPIYPRAFVSSGMVTRHRRWLHPSTRELSCHPEWLHVIADGYNTVAHTPANLRVIRNGYMSSAMVTLLSPIDPRAFVSSAIVTSLLLILLCRCRLHSLTFGVSHRLQRTSPRSTNSKRHRDNFLFFYSNIKPFFSSFSRVFCGA
jgi:hypothetical protein